MKTLQFVENIESQIDYWVKDSDNAFDAQNASVWVLDKDDIATKIAVGPDVYELLENQDTIKTLAKYNTNGFVVFACGWAATLDNCDEDTPPSQALGKRRVRLVVGANNMGIASIVRFKDTPDEFISDEGVAKGSLADAVKAIHIQVMENKLIKKLDALGHPYVKDTNE